MNESRRVRTCVLGTNQALNAGATYVRSLTDLADGEIAIVNGAGYCYDSGTTVSSATEKLRFAVRNGSELLYTPFFTQGKATGTKQAAVHAINQVSYIGYDLSGNSIEVIDSNTYYARIYRREWDSAGNSADIKYGIYKSDATATQSEIAYGLTDSLIANFKREAHTDILFDRVYSGAVTQFTPWTGDYLTFAVTKGSSYITADEAFTVAAGIAVGTILDLAGLAFIVTEIVSTTVVKLDIPWQHDSGYVLWDDTVGGITLTTVTDDRTATLSQAADSPFNVAGTVIYMDLAGRHYKGVMSNTTTGVLLDQPYHTTGAAIALTGGTCAAGGNWGIRCEGQDREFAILTHPYNKVRFDMQILDSGSTTLTLSRKTNEGRGMWQQIAQEEWFCQHAEGKRYNNDSAVAQKRALTDSTKIYNTLVIHYYDDTYTGSVNGTVRSDAEIIIAIPEVFGTTTLMDAVDTALAGITFS